MGVRHITSILTAAAMLAVVAVDLSIGAPALEAAPAPAATTLSTSARGSTTIVSPDDQYMVFHDGPVLKSYEFATGTTVELAPAAYGDFDFGCCSEVPRTTVTADSKFVWFSTADASGDAETTHVVPIDGSANPVDTGGLFTIIGMTSDRVVYFPQPVAMPEIKSRLFDSTGEVILKTLASSPTFAAQVVGDSVVFRDGDVVPPQGGAAVNVLAPGEQFQPTSNDPLIVDDGAFGYRSAELVGATPTLQAIRQFTLPGGSFNPGRTRTADSYLELVEVMGSLTQIKIQPPDRDGTWTVDMATVANIDDFDSFEMAPDRMSATFNVRALASSISAAVYHVDLSGPAGTVVPTLVPGSAGSRNDVFTMEETVFERGIADDRVFLAAEPTGTAAAATRTFSVWEAGQPMNETVDLSYELHVVGEAQSWYLTSSEPDRNGLFASPGFDRRYGGTDLFVSGADGVLRHTSVGSQFGTTTELGSPTGIVVDARRVGDDLAYIVEPTPEIPSSSDECTDSNPFSGYSQFECEGTLYVTDLSPADTDDTCEGNLVTNGDFEDVKSDPNATGDEDIQIATGWGPIWTKASGGSTGDLYAPGFLIPTAEPTPVSGNFAALWADNSASPSLLFREGIMNTLSDDLVPNTGVTALSFTTSQIFVDNAEIGVYGVVKGAPALGSTPGTRTPLNVDLFGTDKVVEFGSFEVLDTDTNDKVFRATEIDTATLPGTIDRIFFTRADNSSVTGRAFVTFDDVCIPPAQIPDVEMLEKPARLMDTRAVGETGDDVAEREGPLGSATNNPFGNGVYRLQVSGRLGVAADASAALLNVTAVNPAGGGFLTVFPCNGATPTPPLSASLNFDATTTAVGDNVTAGLDADGAVCIFSSVVSDIVVDVAGLFSADSGFETIEPDRWLDTRRDGDKQKLAKGTIAQIDLSDVPNIPSDVSAVALNIAAVGPAGQGFITVFPCNVDQPLTASLNFAAGTNVSNGVVIGVAQTDDTATDGTVCFYTSEETHLVVDVGGFHLADGDFVPASPARFLDTRTGAGAVTTDGVNQGAGVVAGGTEFTVQITGRAGVAAETAAVAVNFAAIRPASEAATGFSTAGFVTAYPGPCGARPLTSNLNVSPGDAVKANGAVIGLPPSGEICVFASRNLDVVMDVNGSFPQLGVGINSTKSNGSIIISVF